MELYKINLSHFRRKDTRSRFHAFLDWSNTLLQNSPDLFLVRVIHLLVSFDCELSTVNRSVASSLRSRQIRTSRTSSGQDLNFFWDSKFDRAFSSPRKQHRCSEIENQALVTPCITTFAP